MTISSIDKERDEPLQFRGLFRNVVELEAAYDPASVGSNATVTDDVAVQGVHLGDMVLLSIDIDIQDLVLTANVTATDVVTIVLANTTAGAVNLGPSNVHIICLRPYHSHN